MAKGYWIARVDVRDAERYKDYVAAAKPASQPGAVNAGLFAVAILAGKRDELKKKLADFRAEQAAKILQEKLS